MTVEYCSAEDVRKFLALPNAFSPTTTPTQETVEDRINEAEDYIDNDTGHSFRTTSVSNEYHTVTGVYSIFTGFPIHLSHREITTLLSGTDKIEVWEGSSWVDWVADTGRVEGRSGSYWLDYEKGVLYLKKWARYPKGVRVSYRYGASSVPKDVRKAAILLACADLVESDDRSNLLPESGTSQISYGSKASSWRTQVGKILGKREEFKLPVE